MRKRIANRIFRRATRSEQHFLKQVRNDMLKLVPFVAATIAYPYSILVFPVIGFIAPGLLPSTFQSQEYLVWERICGLIALRLVNKDD